MSYRRLDILLNDLPSEAAFPTAVRDDLTDEQQDSLRTEAMSTERRKHGRWSHLEMLVAQQIDEARLTRAQDRAIAGAKNVKDPEPFPRPGVKRRIPRRVVDKETVARMQAAREARNASIAADGGD